MQTGGSGRGLFQDDVELVWGSAVPRISSCWAAVGVSSRLQSVQSLVEKSPSRVCLLV